MMNITALLFFNKNPNQHTHEHKCCAPKLSFSWWHAAWCHHYQISFKRLPLEILSRTHKKTVGEKSWNSLLCVPLLSLLFHGTVGWLAPSASALCMGESSLHPWGAHSDCWTTSLHKGLNTLHLASCFWSRWTYVWTIRFGILITFIFIQTSRQKMRICDHGGSSVKYFHSRTALGNGGMTQLPVQPPTEKYVQASPDQNPHYFKPSHSLHSKTHALSTIPSRAHKLSFLATLKKNITSSHIMETGNEQNLNFKSPCLTLILT